MTTLHICRDHNFITESRKVFEHYYPGDNIFVVHSLTGGLKMIKNADGFTIMNFYDSSTKEKIERICQENGVVRVVLHALVDYMPDLIKSLKEKFGVKVYWIFWGYELYETIAFEKGFQLTDTMPSIFRKETYYMPNRLSKLIRKLTGNYRPEAFERLFPMIDYFCFWNKADFDLWKKYYDIPARFKFFAYSANYAGDSPRGLYKIEERPTQNVIVNHQASLFGNHDTVFNRLKEIDPDNTLRKIVPLSYGSKPIRNSVLRQGKKLFGEMFTPVLEYMDFDSYCNMLSTIDVAIFGQRRQEASGNIVELLKNGVKVFLRNDNNLLEYYRGRGYIVFSFEDDLKDIDSLKSLTLEQKMHNRQCYIDKRLFYDDFMPGLFNEQ